MSVVDEVLAAQLFAEIQESFVECSYLMTRRKRLALHRTGHQDLSVKALDLALQLRDDLDAMKDVLTLGIEEGERTVVIDEEEGERTLVFDENEMVNLDSD